MPRAGRALEGLVQVVGVPVLVEVHHRVRAEIDGVGTGDVGAVEVVGIEDLHRHGLPPAGGATVREAGPPLSDPPVPPLDLGDQLLHDGVAVGPLGLGVHRVRVVVVRRGVLDLHHQVPGEARGRPVLVELVLPLLLDVVVAVQAEAVAVHARLCGIRRLGAEAGEGRREVAVEDGQGVAGLRVIVEALGEEDPGGQVHVRPPEVGEEVGADAHVLDPLRLLGGEVRHRGDLLGEGQGEGVAPSLAYGELGHRAVEVPRLPGPLLSLSLVGGELHHVAVGAVERLVPVQDGLGTVRSRGKVAEALHRESEHGVGERGHLPRRPPLHVHPEGGLGPHAVGDVETGLALVPLGKHQDQSPVQGLGAPGLGEGDLHCDTVGGAAGGEEHEGGEGEHGEGGGAHDAAGRRGSGHRGLRGEGDP